MARIISMLSFVSHWFHDVPWIPCHVFNPFSVLTVNRLPCNLGWFWICLPIFGNYFGHLLRVSALLTWDGALYGFRKCDASQVAMLWVSHSFPSSLRALIFIFHLLFLHLFASFFYALSIFCSVACCARQVFRIAKSFEKHGSSWLFL